MNWKRHWMVWLVSMIGALGLVACGGTEDSNNNNNNVGTSKATLRVLHMSYDGPAVDVFVDGEKVIDGLAYGVGSAYLSVAAGKHDIKVTETGKTEPALIESSQTLEANKSYTIVAYEKAANITPLVLGYERKENKDKAMIRVIHAADAPAVDVKVEKGDSAPVFGNVEKGKTTEYKAVDAGEYKFVLTAAGDTAEVVKFESVKLEAGNLYTVVARGTLDANDKIDFGARVFVDNGEGKSFLDLKAMPSTPPVKDTGFVRVLHMSYDAPNVDVAVDGKVAISDLAYGMSSGYAELPIGERGFTVTPTGKTEPKVIDTKATLEKDASYTVVAFNALASIKPLLLKDAREVNDSKAKVRVIHAADAPAVDIKVGKADSKPVIPNLEKGKATDYIELDAGDYAFTITAAGDNKAVVSFEAVKLEAGKVYTVIARGTLDAKDKFDFGVRVFIDNEAGKTSLDLKPMKQVANSKVMVIHASPDAPGVDLYVDEKKVNSAALEFPKNTGYLPIPEGERQIDVKPAGSDKSVISAKLPFDASKTYSIFAIGKVADIAPLRIEDDLTAPASGKAHVRFIHLSPDAPAVNIVVKGGPTLFSDKKFKDFTPFTPVDAGKYTIEVQVASSKAVALTIPNLELKDGKIYTVFAKGLLAGKDKQALGAELIVNNP